MMNCHDIEKIIEPYVGGELEPGIRQQIAEHAAHCQDCQMKLSRAVEIHQILGSLPKHTCPDRVLQRVSGRIAGEQKGWWWRRKPAWFRLRPRYAMGAAFGVAIITLLLINLARYSPSRRFTDVPPLYTQEEIAQARQNILLAFGYVHFATNRTQQVIEEDVLPRRVVRPFQQSIEHMNLSKEKGESS